MKGVIYMKNNLLVFGIIAILVILGVGVYASRQKDAVMMEQKPMEEKPSPTDESMISPTEKMAPADSMAPDKDESMMKKSGSYLPFSPEVLAANSENRRVLFFYASWCPTCKPADKNFSDNVSKIPEDVAVIRVNYSDPDTDQAEKDLAKKYGITYQHTFVQIDADGKEIAKWNGGSLTELLSNLK